MEKKTFRVVVITLLLMVMSVGLFAVKAEAAPITLLSVSGKKGVGENGVMKYSFTVPTEADVQVILTDSSAGNYILIVKNSLGEELLSDSGAIAYSAKSFKLHLKKGTYSVSIQNELFLNYTLVVKATATGTVKPTSIKLNKTTATMTKGKSLTLIAAVNPEYTTYDVNWSSSNTKVATVSAKGKVTAKAFGKATIKAKCGTKTAKCEVTVSKAVLEISKGKTKSIKSMLKYVTGYEKATYKTSKSKVVSVTAAGKIKGLKQGKAVITATIKGKTYKTTVYVYDNKQLRKDAIAKLKSMLLNPSSLVINEITGTGNSVRIDFSAMNRMGGYERDTMYAHYEKGVIHGLFVNKLETF